MTKPKNNRERFMPYNAIRQFSSKYIWIIWLLVFIGIIVGIICGIIGFLKYASLISPGSETVNISDAVYSTLKLLKLGDHSNVPSPNGWVTFARFLLPALVSLAAILGLFAFFRKCYHRLRVYGFKNHTIVCGLGKRGTAYILDAIDRFKKGKRSKLDVVVIEKDSNNSRIRFCQDNGITVFIGDATDENILTLAKPLSAKELFSFIPDDGQNVLLANTIVGMFKKNPTGRKISNDKISNTDILIGKFKNAKLKCYLSISNVGLLNQFMDSEIRFVERKSKELLNDNEKEYLVESLHTSISGPNI